MRNCWNNIATHFYIRTRETNNNGIHTYIHTYTHTYIHTYIRGSTLFGLSVRGVKGSLIHVPNGAHGIACQREREREREMEAHERVHR